MMNNLIKQLREVQYHNDAYKVMDKIAAYFGFERFTYTHIFPRGMTRLDLVTIGNYPQEWIKRYGDMHYVLIDPTVKHCVHSLPLLSGKILARANHRE